MDQSNSRTSSQPELVARIRAGDRAAFDTLYEQTYSALWRFAFRFVRSEDVAYDIVQDTFVALWLGHSTWQCGESAEAYLYTAVRNRALNVLRHEQVLERNRPLLLVAESLTPSATTHPAQYAEDQEFAALLETALAHLSERHRTALLLRLLDDKNFQEIGAILGMSAPGAFKLVMAAKAKVEERLLALGVR